MEQTKYTKLSELVDSTFTVEHVYGHKFKMWDMEAKRMVIEDKPFKGGRKMYQIKTDKGVMDVSQAQMGSILEAVVRDGLADINLATIKVTSNGKTGNEIRYFFNEVKESQPQDNYVDMEY